MWNRRFFLSLAAVCLASPPLFAATWHVAPTGDDGNPGSETQPFQTLSQALESAGANDTIQVQGGEYAETLTFFEKPGLTIQGVDNPTIRKHWIVSKGSDGMRIGGFTFDLAGVCNQAAITIRSGVNDVVVENNQVYNAHLGGVNVEAQTNGTHVPNERIVVRNNYFERIPTAIYIIGKQHLVEGNTVVHGTQRTEGCKFISDLDADGVKFYGQDHEIRNNQFWRMSFYTDDSFYNPDKADPLLKNSHTDCFQTSSMDWFAETGQYRNDKTNNVRIHGNVCDAFSIKNLNAGDAAGVMYLEHAENIYFYNNITHSLGLGGQGHVKNLHIFHNTLTMRSEAWRNLDYQGWDADSEAQALVDLQTEFPATISIYNNILYDAHHAPILIYDANWRTTAAAKVRNNLAYWRHGLDGDNGNTSTWHWFDCDKGTVEDEYGNRCADPQFVDSENFDWRLQATSPAINAAQLPGDIAKAESPASDGFGTARSGVLDLGAHEWGETTACASPGLAFPSLNQTEACFTAQIEVDGVTKENGPTVSAGSSLKLGFTLTPAPADQGQTAILLLVARVNDTWFIRDENQNWRGFDGALIGEFITLSDDLPVPIWQGPLFPAEFTIYTGYLLGQRAVFNGQYPLRVVVQARK